MNSVTSKDGSRLTYDVYGQGPALIYVTGAICHRKFSPVVKDAKTLATAFTVYCYDRRGRGDSQDTQPYSLEREVDDIEAIIDAAGGSAFLFGHSSGAVLALEAALKLPTKVKKVLIYDASYVHNETEKKKYSVLRQDVTNQLSSKQNAKALRKFLVGIGMPKPFVYLLPLMPGWKRMKDLAPTLAYDMLLTADVPPLNRMNGIQVPTQVVYGEKSPVSIHEVAKQLGGSIPKAKVLQIPGQDHMVSPKAILPVLSQFFAK